MSADLDESLEAFVFGMQVFVEIYSFVMATAELPINFLHTVSTAAWKLILIIKLQPELGKRNLSYTHEKRKILIQPPVAVFMSPQANI